MGDEGCVDAVLETRALADQMQKEARAFALGAHFGVGQPDRRNEVPARELRQDAGVDAVGLARQRRQPLRFEDIRNRHLPAQTLELVVDKAGAGHRFDGGAHRPAVTGHALDERREPGGIELRGARLDQDAAFVAEVKVEPLAAEIESCM